MSQQTILTPQTLDLIRVSTEFCKYIEQCATAEKQEFCRVMLGLLPLLYLKTHLIPDVPEMPGWNEEAVTEDDYNFVRQSVAKVLGEDDDYLDVFVEDFKYSDTPILCTVSENLADVYQPVRNLVEVFRQQSDCEEALQTALYDTLDQFRLSWGQKLLGALRTLHDISAKTL